MAIELLTLTLDELLDRGEEFLFPGGGVPDLIPRRMWRLVEANPDHPADLPVAACLLVNGKRASSITLPNQTIRFRGVSYPCLWGHLWANLEGNPLPGAGGLLLRQLVVELGELGVGFAATGPGEDAVRVLERLGVGQVTFCPRYVLAVGRDAVSRRLGGSGLGAMATALPVGAAVSAWTALASRALAGEARHYRRLDLDAWNQDLRVLQKDPKADSIHVGRSAEFVGWKESFSRWSAPDMTPRAFSLLRGDEPVGYVNMRHGVHEKLGSRGFEGARLLRVMDCVTDGPQSAAAALYHAIQIARETKCDFLELVTNDPFLLGVARRARLKKSNGMAVYLRCPDDWPSEFREPGLWNVGLMESDGAFAEAPATAPGSSRG